MAGAAGSASTQEPPEYDYLVVGGGIAGVSCAELLAQLHPEASIALLTSSPCVKAVTDFSHLTQMLTSFQVAERGAEDWAREQAPGVAVLKGSMLQLRPEAQTVVLDEGRQLRYGRLSLCTGARPKVELRHPLVLGLRDTESVVELQARLVTARRVVVLGNGGIATELVHELEQVEVVWVIRDDTINSAFLDPGAGQFLKDKLQGQRQDIGVCRRARYSVGGEAGAGAHGSALGPDWQLGLNAKGVASAKWVEMEHRSEVAEVLEPHQLGRLEPHTPQNWQEPNFWPLYVRLTSGRVYGCDFVVSATGVVPQGAVLSSVLKVSAEGGVLVDDCLRTSCERVYAAGDLTTPGWDLAKHWLHMRLWTQARQMGRQAALSMVADARGEEVCQDFSFQMFAHVTKFFGYKVVLLGLFNGQKLDHQYDILLRCTPGMEYVKVVMVDGRMQGAVLIGETDLEETFENLILNQLDLTSYGESLLDPDIDIDDYFD